MDNQEKYNRKLQRINDAIALKEPDMIPCIPMPGTFPFLNAGYSMKDVMYDIEKAKDGVRKYLRDYDPDLALSYKSSYAGLGPFFEMLGCKWLHWAGGPDSVCDDNNMHQFVEKEYLEEDDYPDFLSDMSGYIVGKWLPRGFSALEPLESIDFKRIFGFGYAAGTMQFANEGVIKAFETLAEAGRFYRNWLREANEFDEEMIQMGFPIQWSAIVTTAFDQFSDTLRGTFGILTDLYEQPENVLQAVNNIHPSRIKGAVGQASHSKGQLAFIPLHKGFDGFMSDEQYRTFYWDTLLKLVVELIDAGMTPYVYTEGPYTSRIECLMDLPKGKTIVHFEQADLKKAKKLLGNVACLSGGVSETILCHGNADQVRTAVKENLDILAPGGGCIFDISDTLNNCRPENVEVMFQTVREY